MNNIALARHSDASALQQSTNVYGMIVDWSTVAIPILLLYFFLVYCQGWLLLYVVYANYY